MENGCKAMKRRLVEWKRREAKSRAVHLSADLICSVLRRQVSRPAAKPNAINSINAMGAIRGAAWV